MVSTTLGSVGVVELLSRYINLLVLMDAIDLLFKINLNTKVRTFCLMNQVKRLKISFSHKINTLFGRFLPEAVD
jgi:hypothetical protein